MKRIFFSAALSSYCDEAVIFSCCEYASFLRKFASVAEREFEAETLSLANLLEQKRDLYGGRKL